MPRFLVRGGFLVGSVTFLSLVGLFVFAQTITLLAQIEVVPIAFRRIGYGLLAGLLAGIGTGAVRLLIAYFRLHRTQRITLRGIDELNARAQLRSLAAEETDQAYQIVRDYLDVFPTEEQTLTKIGFSPGQAEELLAACRDLKDPKKDLGPAQWLRRFRQKFQSIVDAAADACIKRHAMGVAVKFAAVPLPLVETAVVLHGALTMIADLCQIYRLRLGASSTVIVAGWAAIQGLLPGRVDEWTGKEAVSST